MSIVDAVPWQRRWGALRRILRNHTEKILGGGDKSDSGRSPLPTCEGQKLLEDSKLWKAKWSAFTRVRGTAQS